MDIKEEYISKALNDLMESERQVPIDSMNISDVIKPDDFLSEFNRMLNGNNGKNLVIGQYYDFNGNEALVLYEITPYTEEELEARKEESKRILENNFIETVMDALKKEMRGDSLTDYDQKLIEYYKSNHVR